MANPFLNIPDWLSWDNQGAGIAVSDLSNNGQQALIVLMVDSAAGKNKGLYRVGKNLDVKGTVSGGWGDWIEIPDWFSFENQGAGVALADLDGDGRPELVVFMIDNPAGKNHGYYRIGKTLDADGNVTGGWSPWIPVPDWVSWENQGAGVALAGLRNTGVQDLIIFQIDNAIGQNQAFFRIGKDLKANGTVADGWSTWHGVPDWFSHEKQGGGIAATTLGGKHKMFILNVDSPVQQNAGLYQLLDLDPDPAREGTWDVLSFYSGVLAVHAALLHTGKVSSSPAQGAVRCGSLQQPRLWQ